jgi:prefoldin subunit 5
MRRPDLPERVQTLEDELAGLESMIDSRTRILWQSIEKLRGEMADLQRLHGNLETAQKAQGGKA